MKIHVLDHGYVEFIEGWGTGKSVEWQDETTREWDRERGIIEAARQSTQGAFRDWEKDRGLLKHLFMSEPQHATPFEFAGMVIEVQAPIFVFREWHRHRTQSYNEMSARYAPLPDLHYLPEMSVCTVGDDHSTARNKQAQGISDKVPSEGEIIEFLSQLEQLYSESERVYQYGLGVGIPKQTARLSNVVARYSKMRASANLRNWLAFLQLRLDPRAQPEIRKYAEAVSYIVEAKFPHVWELYKAKYLNQVNVDGTRI